MNRNGKKSLEKTGQNAFFRAWTLCKNRQGWNEGEKRSMELGATCEKSRIGTKMQ